MNSYAFLLLICLSLQRSSQEPRKVKGKIYFSSPAVLYADDSQVRTFSSDESSEHLAKVLTPHLTEL